MSTQAQPQSPAPDSPAATRAQRSGQPMPDVMAEIISFNSENDAHEDLWSRTRQATDQVGRAELAARQADTKWANADLSHKSLAAEYPERSASRPRQWIIAAGALALDAVACYFAAEPLGGSPAQTLLWALLFLALLGAGEFTLDLYRDTHPVLWRWTAAALGVFVGLLGVLRFWFLAAVGSEGLVTAVAGAFLFTMATAGFVVIGYRALRAAETSQAWRARRQVRTCRKTAEAAHRRVERLKLRCDRLAGAYLGRIRTRLIKNCSGRPAAAA